MRFDKESKQKNQVHRERAIQSLLRGVYDALGFIQYVKILEPTRLHKTRGRVVVLMEYVNKYIARVMIRVRTII